MLYSLGNLVDILWPLLFNLTAKMNSVNSNESKENFERLKAIACTQIRKRKYAAYRKSITTFKLNHPKTFKRHTAADIFNLKAEDMHVHLLELSLYFNQNKILIDDFKAWEKVIFDQLHIPIEDRIKSQRRSKLPRLKDSSPTESLKLIEKLTISDDHVVDCSSKSQNNQFQEFVDQFQFSKTHRLIHPDLLPKKVDKPAEMPSLPDFSLPQNKT